MELNSSLSLRWLGAVEKASSEKTKQVKTRIETGPGNRKCCMSYDVMTVISSVYMLCPSFSQLQWWSWYTCNNTTWDGWYTCVIVLREWWGACIHGISEKSSDTKKVIRDIYSEMYMYRGWSSQLQNALSARNVPRKDSLTGKKHGKGDFEKI